MARKDQRLAPPPASPYLRGQPQPAPVAHRLLPWLGLLLALAVLLVPLLGENGLVVLLRLRSQRDDLQRDVRALSADADTLQVRIDALAQDPSALEKLARERYNLRKPGEDVLLIVPSDRADASP